MIPTPFYYFSSFTGECCCVSEKCSGRLKVAPTDSLVRFSSFGTRFYGVSIENRRKMDGQWAIEYTQEVGNLIPAVWLMLGSLLYSLQLSSGSFPRPLTAKEEAYYLDLASKGDLEARNILVERNLRLVAHIMKKYYTQTSDQEDLISIGTIGLIKGISTFDTSKGARLATYAARCVENEILMHFRSQKKSSQDVSLSDYIETGSDGAALSLMDVVAEEEDLLETVSTRERIAQVRRAVQERLDDREKQVILLRYGLQGCDPQRQREVAKILNISRSYVSRIEKRALQKLQQELQE